MNRSAGITEERIDAYGDNLPAYRKLHPGTCARDKAVQMLAPTTGSQCWPNGASWRCSITGIGRSS